MPQEGEKCIKAYLKYRGLLSTHLHIIIPFTVTSTYLKFSQDVGEKNGVLTYHRFQQ